MPDGRAETEHVDTPPQAPPPPHRPPVPVEPGHLYRAVALLFLFALLYRFFPEISRVFLLLYAAGIVAVALNALVRRLPAKRGVVTALIAVAILGSIGAALAFGVPLVIDQVRGLAQRGPEMEQRLHEWERWLQGHTGFEVTLVGPGAVKWMKDTFLSNGAAGGMLGRAQGVVEVFAIPFFLLVSGLFAVASPNRNLLDGLMRSLPRDLRPAIRRVLELLAERILGWLRGTLVGMAAVATLSFIFFKIIGVPNALVLALFCGLTEFIPIVGPLIGGSVAVVVAFLDEPSKGMWAAIAVLAVQQIENHLIIPFAMARTADVHPVVTVFALMLFGALFGFLGVLLALPLVLLFWTLVQVLWVERTIDTDQDRIAPVVTE
ncbi:MAG TPA: AI-2E family transporter [Longimicrobiaceae bacterium]|nr:AI-2E family transporter [Longimicrobiaceae bacterium]